MGEELGVEVGRVWRTGAKTLPAIAAEVDTAQSGVNTSLTSLLSRTGCVGTDVSSRFEDLRGLILKALKDTEEAVRDCGTALVWTAEDYTLTDEAARDAYEREKKRVD